MDKLKRCPFCGSGFVAIVNDDGTGWRVRCTDCMPAESTCRYILRDNAVRAWNREYDG